MGGPTMGRGNLLTDLPTSAGVPVETPGDLVYERHGILAAMLIEDDSPRIVIFPGTGIWRLVEDTEYRDPDTGAHLYLPAPFDFDGASIPRLLWSAIGKHELGVRAPLWHDWLYRGGGKPSWGHISGVGGYTRAMADRLFRRHLEEDEVPRWRRTAAWAAVRAFGQSSWRSP